MKIRLRQRGFTLIEAIVAMVLFATAGMALFSWINSNIIALSRVQDANAESAATVNVVDFMNSVNPALTPQGEENLGDYVVSWNSAAVAGMRDGAGYPEGVGLFQLAPYQTNLTVRTPDGKTWFSFSLQQLGYRKVRQP